MVDPLQSCKAGHKGLGFLTGPSRLLKAVSSSLISSHPSINLLIFKGQKNVSQKANSFGVRQDWSSCLPQPWDGDGQGNYSNSAGETRIFLFPPFPPLIERQVFFLVIFLVFQHWWITHQRTAGSSPSGTAFVVSSISSRHYPCSAPAPRICSGLNLVAGQGKVTSEPEILIVWCPSFICFSSACPGNNFLRGLDMPML